HSLFFFPAPSVLFSVLPWKSQLERPPRCGGKRARERRWAPAQRPASTWWLVQWPRWCGSRSGYGWSRGRPQAWLERRWKREGAAAGEAVAASRADTGGTAAQLDSGSLEQLLDSGFRNFVGDFGISLGVSGFQHCERWMRAGPLVPLPTEPRGAEPCIADSVRPELQRDGEDGQRGFRLSVVGARSSARADGLLVLGTVSSPSSRPRT
ncbi:unnamed protein product, partial [Urochloa humidicola]